MPSSDKGATEIAERVIARATKLGVHLAVAESLTGGLVAATLVAVPGASRAFNGAIIAYDTALKSSLLGVDPDLLHDVGPVDAQVARQMATGVRAACGKADVGVATTGVAGPGPDPQTGQPAGTVWIGVSSVRGDRAVLLENGARGRAEIRGAAVTRALALLLDEISADEVGVSATSQEGEAHE